MTIQEKFLVHAYNEEGRAESYEVHLRYDTSNPWAIALEVEENGSNTWLFSRELIRDGLKGHAGLGDVRVWCEGIYLFIRLSSPNGQATLRFSRRHVIGLLTRTKDLVPFGREDMDDALAEVEKLMKGWRR